MEISEVDGYMTNVRDFNWNAHESGIATTRDMAVRLLTPPILPNPLFDNVPRVESDFALGRMTDAVHQENTERQEREPPLYTVQLYERLVVNPEQNGLYKLKGNHLYTVNVLTDIPSSLLEVADRDVLLLLVRLLYDIIPNANEL